LPKAPQWSFLDSPLFWQIVEIILWLIVAIAVIWLLWRIALLISPQLSKLVQSKFRVRSPKISQELTGAQWLNKARNYYQIEDYRQACFCLYQAMLQKLHDRNLLPHQLSRTDGEYLRFTEQLEDAAAYRLLLNVHQKLCFSNREASVGTFDECQQAYQVIDSEEK
jgi:hypothetical protein